MMLLMMLLTATTAWAEEVMVPYAVTYNTTTKKTTLTHNGGNHESVTWNYMSGTNSTPWNGGATHGVDDEYGITFMPNKYLTLVGSDIKTSAETKFTVTVGDNAYYIKSVGIDNVTATADLHAKTIEVTVPDNTYIRGFNVTLIRYHTVTPASGLHVTSGTSATSGGTTYYKPGTIVTVAPTNTHHIVEGTGGTGSASVSVASDKRSFSFTMPDQDVSPTATLTEVYRVSPASGITLSPAAYFTYGGAQYYKPNTTITLSSTVPTGQHVIYKAGNKTLGGNTYTVNSSDGDVTLTAEYPYNTYTVQFNGNGSTSGSMSNQSFTYATAQNLKANAFTRTGYTFAGWNTQADGNGTSYANGESVNNLTTTNGGTVTLYAQWTANTYTVTLNKQDGNGGSASATATYDAAMPAITVPTRTGYTFGGYFTQTNGGGTQYYNADGSSTRTCNLIAATTLYAKWTANTYTVTLNKQDGNGGSASATATYDAAMPAITVPTRTGYTFGGYFTQTNGGGTQYYNADGTSTRTWNLTAATTLYAKWAIITYNITYELNGGSVSTANPTSYNIETPTFTLNNPSKKNYHFVGWTKDNNNTLLPTVTIEQGSTGNLDYTAHYKTNNFTVGEFSYQWTSGTEVKVTACNSDATLITIPATVTNEDVIYSVTAIDASAFSGCTNLLAVILESDTPPTLGSNAFSACTALNAIGVPEGTAAAYKATAGWLDYEDKIYAINGKCGTNVYYSYNSTTTTLSIFGTGAMADYTSRNIPWDDSYRTEITTVVIGDGVTSIGSMAFNGCTGLTSIEIPASVMTIGHDAFNSCTSLKSITIPASVTSIGDFAFIYCTSLESVEIPASVTYIGGEVFYGCTSLTSITIPASVTSIDDFAFVGCTSLASISVAEGNPTYDSRKKCNAIIKTKTNTLLYGCMNTVIPDGVTSIGVAAFAHCTSLKSITIPACVTRIGDYVFERCTSLESIVIPASVTSIGDNVFCGCTSLKSIVIPASVTSIGVAAFADTSLESITIPASVTSIDSCAFYYCTSLKSVEIPASVTYIGGAAFADCTSLSSVTIYAPELSEYGWKAFENNASGRKIYVFNKSLATYKAQASKMRVDENDILPIESISLQDAADNSALIAAANDNILDVTLQSRTLYKDGAWNTLCLPFNVDLTAEGCPLAGADIRRLSADIVYEGKTTGFDPDGGVLTLNFTPKTGDGAVTDIKAGVPYIVKWASGDDIVNPVFSGVTVSNATTTQSFDGGRVQFIGTYSPETLTGGDSSNLYLGSGNKLYWPSSDKTIGAFRGYFHVSSPAAAVRAFVLNFGDEETTGIVDIEHGTLNMEHSADAGWYDLSGRKLPAKPTQPGLYINNGRKFAIK